VAAAFGVGATLLQALRRGPGYGLQIVRRVREAAGSPVGMGPGTVYPALRALEDQGLVRRWIVTPGRQRGGRARIYYELTLAGVEASEAGRRAFTSLAEIGSSIEPSPRQPRPELLRRRLRRISETAAFLARSGAGLRAPRSR
jgi:PadR family transcriptional regulator PadR